MGLGYIKLYRQSLDNGWLRQGDLWRFWCWCLLKAYHKPQTVTIGLQRVDIKIGQFPFGRKAAAKELKMSEQTVRTLLSKLIEWQNLTISSTNKFSVVIVVNWESYQGEDSKPTINLTSSQPTTNQQLTTNKNVKNVKKVKNPAKFFAVDSPEFKLAEFLWHEMKKRGCEDKEPDLQKWAVHTDCMLRLDKKEPKRVAEVIRWTQQDGFWHRNIRSTFTLRDKWPALVDEMEAEKNKNGKQAGYKACVHPGCECRVPMADNYCPACRGKQSE